jgi:CyaY protein
MPTMERDRFIELSSQSLERIEQALADLEHDDLDVELAGDVLTLAFADGAKFIINAHSAAGQIWMAANRNAWHFDYHPDSERWVAHKTDDELLATVSRVVGDKLGVDIAWS